MSVPTPLLQDRAPGGPGPRKARDALGQTLLRARLLFSSYAPLNLILYARIDGGVRYGFLALGIVGFLDANRLTWLAGGLAAAPRSFTSVRDSGAEVAGYLATYLLPFLAAPHVDAGDIWAYGIYAVVVIVITLRSNLAHINPTIYVLGWKVVTVTLQDGRDRYLVCRRTPAPGERVAVTELFGVLHSKN
jgi:hypothetical protein